MLLIRFADYRSFLDESRNTDLIRWSDSGDSFIVLDEDEFAKTLIPELFKHNNYASFVRQLNMYGFHKKVGLSDNSMRASERKNKNPSEYSNPYFKRGRPNLLWLIHKPKNAAPKPGSKGRNRPDDYDEDVEETFGHETSPITNIQDNVEGPSGFPGRQQPLLTMGNMASRLPQDDLTNVRRELKTLQENQRMIKEMLKQIRQEHQQLYGQAKAFHDLHEKHDNSINAILTFLATVYNKNLTAGQTGTGDMFPGKIQAGEPPRGNVVDMGDDKVQSPQTFRRPQLLLEDGNLSPADASSQRRASRRSADKFPSPNQQSMHSPAVQELSDYTPSNRSSESPPLRPDTTSSESRRNIPEADILRMMNNASAQSNVPKNNSGTHILDFPEALSHLQNANGQSPLTPNQRQNMLQLMANEQKSTGTSPQQISFPNIGDGNDGNNGLTFPSDTAALNDLSSDNLSKFDHSSDQLSNIQQSLRQQEERMNALHQTIAPLSPSGSIPGVNDGSLPSYNNNPYGAPDMFDIDQLFNSDDYFNDLGAAGGGEDGGDLPDFDFNTSEVGGGNDEPIVPTTNNSAEGAQVRDDDSPAGVDGDPTPSNDTGPQRSKRRKGADGSTTMT